jgi:hypothetical protein
MKLRAWAVALALMGCARAAEAQMGMDYFARPAITRVFHPTVGKGAAYETTTKMDGNAKTSTLEMGVVGKESVDGKEAYWIETSTAVTKGDPMVGKMLMSTEGELTIHRMIVQQPGQQAMEMPMNMAAAGRGKLQENMNDWHSLGTESITVPAGTFGCEHWKNEKTGAEIWTSDKVPAYGVVKELFKERTMVLTKVLDNYPDKITGPVRKFDLQEMMQQRQQKP